MTPERSAIDVVATLGIQLQLAGSLLCVLLGLVLGRGIGRRPWVTWWTAAFGAIALAVFALLVRYSGIPLLPLESLRQDESLHVAALYAAYGGAKLFFFFCLLAGTWLFVTREQLTRVGVGAGLMLILGVTLLFVLAPTELNGMMVWQAGFATPVLLACAWLLAQMPAEHRTRGSRLLAGIFTAFAGLWLLYIPGFLNPDTPASTAFGRAMGWVVAHNSYFDVLFEFLLGFGMILAVLDDVFRKAEGARTQRLREVAASEARLAQIIRAASDGIVLLDAERRIVHCNPAVLDMLRSAEAELVGTPFDRFVTTGTPEDLWVTAVDQARRTGTTPGGGHQLVGRRADGSEIPLEISLRAIGVDTAEGFVLIVRDRTQQVREEAERERTQAQLSQAARLETIGRMVSGVAHELNNPLTAILAFAQDLLSQSRSSADTEALTTIVSQSQRCRAIVQDLLITVRSNREGREPIVPSALIVRVLPALERQAAERGVRLDVEVPNNLPPLNVSPAAMEQVLTNLVVNAFHSAGSNGMVRILARMENDRVALVVEDDGPGLAPEVLPRLFEPFFTTKAQGEGTGLGLSVSHAIVDQHGGTLLAENRIGAGERGARFTMLLPFLDRRAASRSPAQLPPSDLVPRAAPPAGSVAPRRLLIVDDEAPIRVAIRRFFERRGWTVEEAGDGRQALELLGLDGPGRPGAQRYHAIVSDLRMPGVTGMEIHDRLAAADPEALRRLVLVTGDTASSEVADFIARLRRPLLQKPFDMVALADLLDRTAPPTPASPIP